jgi:hypothetical protein
MDQYIDQYAHIGPHLHKFVNFDFSDICYNDKDHKELNTAGQCSGNPAEQSP